MASLTPAQRRVLEAAQRGELFQSESIHDLYSIYAGPFGNRRKVSSIANRLIDSGHLEVAEREPSKPFRREIVLTAEGLAVLGVDTEKEN